MLPCCQRIVRRRLRIAGLWALAAGGALVAIVGCASGPSETDLRAALVEQVRRDDLAYNRRMNRYGAPRPEIDGSAFTMTRSRRALAVKPSQIRIRATGGRTTTHEAEVPRIIETYIKSGLSEEECLAAPERVLQPQRVVSTYEYDVVTHQWHEARPEGVGNPFGL